MNNEHITDRQAQEFLDSKSVKDPRVLAHINICAECRNLIELYASIYKDLSNPIPALAPAALTDRIMAGLPEPEKNSRRSQILNTFFFIGLGIIMLGITQYFTDLVPVGKNMLDSLAPSLNMQKGVIMDTGSFSPDALEKFKLLFVTAGILGGVYLLDRIFSKKRFLSRVII
jgi:hypothetical protein